MNKKGYDWIKLRFIIVIISILNEDKYDKGSCTIPSLCYSFIILRPHKT